MDNCKIRASYDENSITIYQAFNEDIAYQAVKNQRLTSPPFKMDRMTWIKPSFLWMMYRSGWATKKNQEHILSIKIKRDGFEWALENSCLSHFDNNLYASYDDWKLKLQTSPVRIQWDPEKNIFFEPLPYRSIQIGLSGIAVKNYVNEWTLKINDITSLCKKIHHLVRDHQTNEAIDLLPVEKYYLPKTRPHD